MAPDAGLTRRDPPHTEKTNQMASGNNTVKCPKCGQETQSLVSTVNGTQYVVCPGCKTLLKVEVKQGQFTGKVQT